MVFTWQVPMMFMAYSFLCYIIGLTVMACSPLLQRQPWGPESNVAIAYLSTFGVGYGIFIYCSLMGYEQMDVDAGFGIRDDDTPHVVPPKGEGSGAWRSV